METLRYVVLANGLLAVVGIAYYVLLRNETFFAANRLALWLSITGALVLPLLELPDWRPQHVRSMMQRTAQVIVPKVLPKPANSQPDVTITFPNRKTYQAFRTQTKRISWSWQTSAVAIYITGVVLLLIRFCSQLISLRKLIRQSVHEPYDSFTLVKNEVIKSPFSFFRWVVVNINQHTPNELEQILRHERVHVREWHSFDMIGAELVSIFFWFNPAAYLLRHLLHQTLEFMADRAVLAEGVDAKAYQYNLLKVSLLSGQSAITNHFIKSQLKSRIVMLNRQASPKISWLKYPAVFIAALTVASSFARPHLVKIRSSYVPKPVAKTIDAIEILLNASAPTAMIPEAKQEAIKLKFDRVSTGKMLTQPVEPQLDPVRNLSEKDSVRSNSSSNVVNQGDYPYWIATPETTFDDLSTDDKATSSGLIDDKKLESMVMDGQHKYSHLGMGFRRFDKEEIKKQSTPNSALSVKSDGSIVINEAPGIIKAFINNKPVTLNDLQHLKITQLYSVAVILGYDAATNKRTGIDYLFFYVDKDK